MGQQTNLPVIFQPPNLFGSWLNIIQEVGRPGQACDMANLAISLQSLFKYIFSMSSPYTVGYIFKEKSLSQELVNQNCIDDTSNLRWYFSLFIPLTKCEKNKKIQEKTEKSEIFYFFENFCFFRHFFKGIHREMYLSFILATFFNSKFSCYFSHFFKGIHREMYLSFILATFCNSK